MDSFIIMGSGSRALQSAPAALKGRVLNFLLRDLERVVTTREENIICLTGMAQGFDHAFAIAALEMNLDLHAIVPNAGFRDYYWGKNSLTGKDETARFNEILSNCKSVEYAARSVYQYMPDGSRVHSNMVRNSLMVGRANGAYVYGRTPGPRDARAKLIEAGVPVKEVSVK